MQRSLTKHAGLLVIAAATLLVAAVGAVTLFQFNNTREARGWVTRTYDAIAAAKDLCIAVRGAESGRRGFLLTGRETELTAYDGALARIDRLQADLPRLTGGNASQGTRLRTLDTLLQAKRDELAASIALRRESGFT